MHKVINMNNNSEFSNQRERKKFSRPTKGPLKTRTLETSSYSRISSKKDNGYWYDTRSRRSLRQNGLDHIRSWRRCCLERTDFKIRMDVSSQHWLMGTD